MFFQSLNMQLNAKNSLKLVLMTMIFINLIMKLSNNIKLDNLFISISFVVIIITIFIDIQISLLLFLLLLTFFYHSKHISFDLIPQVHYYYKNEAIEAFNNDKDKEDQEELEAGQEDQEEAGQEDQEQAANEDQEQAANEDQEDAPHEDQEQAANEDQVKENFEQPVNIPDKLKELENIQQIKDSVKLYQSTEEKDLNDFISHSVYVPFEQLNSIQNNTIQSFDNDQELLTSINDNYYEVMSQA